MGCFFGGKNRKPLEQETLRPVKSYSSLYDNEPTLLPDPHAVEIPKNSHEKQPAANSRTKEFFRGSSLVKNRPRVLSAPSRVFGSELDLQSTFIDGSEVVDRLPVSTATNPSAAGGFGLCTWKNNTEAASLVGRAVPLPVPQEARHPLPLPLSRGDSAHKISGGSPVLQNSSSASNSRHSNVLKPCQLSSFGSEPQPLPLPSQVVSTSSLRLFLREEILAGCQNFSPSYWLRDTHVGPVYRCSVKKPGSNEKMEVAVTRISRSNIEGEGEHLSSFETHAQVQSPFVSKLLGLCMPKAIGRRRENVEWLLVSEHVESESLETLLRKQDQSSLDWSARVKIALGTAKALDYLHEEKFRLQQCFDGDFDLCNIQVEKNFNPKLSDYGFQWLLKHDVSEAIDFSTDTVLGRSGREKVAVRNFGKLLLALVIARQHLDKVLVRDDELLQQITPILSDDAKLGAVLDPALKGHHMAVSIRKVVSLAYICLQDVAELRPHLQDIVEVLHSVQDIRHGNIFRSYKGPIRKYSSARVVRNLPLPRTTSSKTTAKQTYELPELIQDVPEEDHRTLPQEHLPVVNTQIPLQPISLPQEHLPVVNTQIPLQPISMNAASKSTGSQAIKVAYRPLRKHAPMPNLRCSSSFLRHELVTDMIQTRMSQTS